MVKINGSQSAAERMLRKKLKARGVDEDTINDYMKISSENQIRDDLKRFVEEDALKSDEQQSEIEKKQAEVTEKTYKMLLKGGVNKNVAWANSKLFGVFYKNFGSKDNAAFDKWFNKLDVRYNVTPEELHNQLKQEAFYQPAMYFDKNSQNVNEFFNKVNNNFDEYKKAKYQFKNLKLSLPADTVKHDEKHQLTANDWQEIENNISNIYIANKINGKNNYGDNLYVFGIKTDTGNYYYVCVAINNKDNLIVTATKNTQNGVDSYVTGKGKTPSKVPNALPPVAPFSKKSSNDIITYLNQQLNPNVNVYYQQGYHGSGKKFDEFDTEYIGSGEGAQAHGWGLYFAGDKDVSEEYRKRLVNDYYDNDFIKYDGDLYIRNSDGSWYMEDESEYWESDSWLATILDNFRSAEDKEKTVEWLQSDYDEILSDIQDIVDENNLDSELLKVEDERFVNDGGNEYFDSLDEYIQDELQKCFRKLDVAEAALKGAKNHRLEFGGAGQLYEVDIPEDDVLLDEDKPFNEQSEKVKNALLKLFNDINIDKSAIKRDIEFLEFEIEELKNNDVIDYDYTEYLIEEKEKQLQQLKLKVGIKDIKKHNYLGKGIYRTLSEIYDSDKLASEKLNEYGIKGIKYNGQEDGECFVIFDDKSVDILNTFYQESLQNREVYNLDGSVVEDVANPLAYDYINFKNSNEKIEIKINPDLMGSDNEIVEPIEINAYDVKSKTNFKNNIANEIKINLFGTTGKNIQAIKATNKKTGQTVDINGRTINESTKELLKGTEKNLVASILLNSKNIFENSELILINDEAKNENLKNKQTVFRYATQIKYNNEKYIVISTVFDNQEKTQISIYHIAGYKNSVTDKHQKMSGDNTNISISQLRDFVKSKIVEQYNNDYRSAYEKLNVLKQSEYDAYIEKERRKNYERFNSQYRMPYSYEAIADKLKKTREEWVNFSVLDENGKLPELAECNRRQNKLHDLTEQVIILEDYLEDGKDPDKVIKIMSDDGSYETNTTNNNVTDNSTENKSASSDFSKQTQENKENEKLIAGYSYQEVMDKLTSLYSELNVAPSEEEANEIIAKCHVLEDSFVISENPEKYSTTQVSDTMLNVYYIMNNQKIPDEFLESEMKSARTAV